MPPIAPLKPLRGSYEQTPFYFCHSHIGFRSSLFRRWRVQQWGKHTPAPQRLDLEGRAPVVVKAGEAFVEPPNVKMTGYNKSATDALRVAPTLLYLH